ncbi:MAG TPA: NAD(P)H-binding protein [Anaerolineaceae bacterium]|nr:NAD(P)H-binding protein [Anaerolineaceae bacterium]
MILVTGGTGFIGQVLIRHLVSSSKPVRSLIRPSRSSPNLPRGVPVEAAVCGIKDERGLRAAMKGVDTIFHLAGAERWGGRGDLLSVDIQGTQAIARAAADAGVQRIFYLSHLGADRASAYPVLKAKAIAESYIRQSGVPYTILRSAVAFGPGDTFTSGLAILANMLPGIFFLPGDGSTLIQPIWVEDLVTCLTWSMDNPATINQTLSLGGADILTFRQAVEEVLIATDQQRLYAPVSPAYLRAITVMFEHLFPAFPISVFWMDYLAADRACGVDDIHRVFGLLPARFNQRLEHLKGQPWRKRMFRLLAQREARI